MMQRLNELQKENIQLEKKAKGLKGIYDELQKKKIKSEDEEKELKGIYGELNSIYEKLNGIHEEFKGMYEELIEENKRLLLETKLNSFHIMLMHIFKKDILLALKWSPGLISLFSYKAIHENCEDFNKSLDKFYQCEHENHPKACIEFIRFFKLLNDVYYNNFIYRSKRDVHQLRASDYYLPDVPMIAKSQVIEHLVSLLRPRVMEKKDLVQLINEHLRIEKAIGNPKWREIFDLPADQMYPDIYEEKEVKSEINSDAPSLTREASIIDDVLATYLMVATSTPLLMLLQLAKGPHSIRDRAINFLNCLEIEKDTKSLSLSAMRSDQILRRLQTGQLLTLAHREQLREVHKKSPYVDAPVTDKRTRLLRECPYTDRPYIGLWKAKVERPENILFDDNKSHISKKQKR